MKSVTVEQVVTQALAAPQTVAHALGGQQISHWLTPILGCSFDRFCLDSRRATPQCGFVLLSSAGKDQATALKNANSYLQAVKTQASFVISEMDIQALDLSDIVIPVVYVPKIRHFLGDLIAARFQLDQSYDLPKVVAVTGTNGKTTVSQLVAQLGQLSGLEVAIMGTAGNGRLGQLTQAANTTGDVLMVHEFLYDMARQGVDLVALEASSHGLDQYRLQGIPVNVAVYTNLSHDHLDYHADMQAYRDAKARLFDRKLFPTLVAGVVNADADYALFDKHQADYPVISYAQRHDADYQATEITPSLSGVHLSLKTPSGPLVIDSPLLGLFNVDNLLAALAAFNCLYPGCDQLPSLVAQLQGARGRMQKAQSKQGCFIVDYAHTPDALVQVLSSLRRHCTGRLIAVFGCGGDRDRTKRPLMTKAGLDYADQLILTADNPRSENPQTILSDMQQGLGCDDHYKILIEPDRRLAIELAVKMAKANDIVVIAGKGHETYQEIQGVRHDFDDLAVLEELLTIYQNK